MKKRLCFAKKIFCCFAVATFVVTHLSAQVNTLYNTPQAPNFDFEKWDEDYKLWGWNSSTEAEFGNSPSREHRKQSLWKSNDKRPGGRGNFSAYIKVTQSDWYHYKFPFGTTSREWMGTITTGVPYYYDDKNNSATCMYTNTGSDSKRWDFTARPDSIVFWAKAGVNGGRNCDMRLYLHNNAKLEDRAYGNTAVGTVIGRANVKFNNTAWQRYSVPIFYERNESPSYLLLSFTAGNNFREVVEGDELWVDDVKLIYNPKFSLDKTGTSASQPWQLAHHGSEALSFEVPYTFYTGTEDPIDPNVKNELLVYLSDANGNLDSAKVVARVEVPGSDHVWHNGNIKVSLPANTPDSDKYRLYLAASNYKLKTNVIYLSIYKEWYLTIGANRYGRVNAKNRVICRHKSRQAANAEPNEDCVFLRWEENGKTLENAGREYTFEITSDRDLQAVFDTTYTLHFPLSIVGANAYFANNNQKSITLVRGDTAKLRTDLDPGYCFKGYVLNGKVWSGSKNHNIPASFGGTIQVLTDSIPYDYRFSVYPKAKLGSASGSGVYKHFGTVRAVAKASSPYSRFLRWEDTLGRIESTDTVLTFRNIKAGGHYRAVFQEQFQRVNLLVNEAERGDALQCERRVEDSAYSAFDCTRISLRALPERGFVFTRWEVTKNGIAQTAVTANPYLLTDSTHIDADYVFRAVFDTQMCQLNLSAENGKAFGEGVYAYGKRVMIHATPNEEHHFVKWVSGAQTIGTGDTLYVRMFRDTALKAVFEPNQYTVTVISNDESLGDVDKQTGLYAWSSKQLFTALPAAGAELRYWVLDGDTVSDAAAYTLEVLRDCELKAIFSHTRSHVTLTSSNASYGKVFGAGIYEWHSKVQLRAEVSKGYRFIGWETPQGDTIFENPLAIDHIEGDTVLQAIVVPLQFKVKLQKEGNGNVFVESTENEAKIDYMDYVSIKAVAQDGYEFDAWYDAENRLLSTYAEESFSVWRDTVINARFVRKRYSVNLFIAPLGSSVLHGMGRYPCDSMVTIRVDDSEDFNFLGWYDETDEKVGENMDYTFRLTRDRSFVAKFESKKFIIGLRANPASAAVSCIGAGEYRYNYNTALSVIPKEGYEVGAWLNVQGDTLSREANYLHFVTGAEAITVYLRPATLNAVFEVKPDGAGRVSNKGLSHHVPGKAVAQAAYGYVFSHWEDKNGNKTSEQENLDILATKDTFLTAVFKPASFNIEGVASIGTVVGSGNHDYLSVCSLRLEYDEENYAFEGWFDEENKCRSVRSAWNFEVTEPLSVRAKLIPRLLVSNIAVEPANAGVVKHRGAQQQGQYKTAYKDSLRFEPVPSKGMVFKKWKWIDGEGNPQEWTAQDHVFLPQAVSSLTAVFDTLRCQISVQAEPADAGTVGGEGEYKYASFAGLKAHADTHYEFSAFMVGDKVISCDTLHALRVDSNTHVRAVFQPIDYTLILFSSNPTQGKVRGEGRHPYGEKTLAEAYVWNDNMIFSHWSTLRNGSDTISRQARYMHAMRGNDTLYAFFAPTVFDLQVQKTGKGTVIGDSVYPYRSEARLVATPAKGWHFSAWKERGMEIGRENTLRITMQSNRLLEAVFIPDTFNLTLVSEVDGVELFGAGLYACESKVNVSYAGVPKGYRFTAWENTLGEVASVEEGFTFDHTQDTVFYAKWQPIRCYLGLQKEGEGEVLGEEAYSYGSQVCVRAKPAPGHRLAAWYHNQNLFSRADSLCFNLTMNMNLRAVFEKDTQKVEVLANTEDRGVVQITDTDAQADVQLLAVAKTHYHFTNWSLGDSVISTEPQIEVERNIASQITAHFMPDVHKITLHSTTPEGLMDLDGSGTYVFGEAATLSVTLRDGYEFLGWYEEGNHVAISTQTEVTIAVTRSQKIEARSAKK